MSGLVPVAAATGWWVRWLGLGQLALIAATWPLWTPQTLFPQVPLLAIGIHCPPLFDWVLTGVALLAALVWVLGPVTTHRLAAIANTVALAGLIVLDQHRCQPWAWQLLVLSSVIACDGSKDILRGALWLTCSIYLYSAWSKLDPLFASSLGPYLADGLTMTVGYTPPVSQWPAPWKELVGWSLPIGELITALLLLPAITRGLGVGCAALLHGTLLVMLGPWGHDHQPGILIWNVWFAGQNVLLWLGTTGVTLLPSRRAASLQTVTTHTAAPQTRLPLLLQAWGGLTYTVGFGLNGWSLGRLILVGALWWPSLHDLGYIDHWPAWAVFSARAGRCTIQIPTTDLPTLAAALVPYVAAGEPADPWRVLRVDRWSLVALRSPISPDRRFYFGVAQALLEQGLVSDVRVRHETETVWPTAAAGPVRERQTWPGRAGLQAGAQQFWFNSVPRLVQTGREHAEGATPLQKESL